MEAFQTSDGTEIRTLRRRTAFLGERVAPEIEMDVEEVRLQRAVRLLEKSGGKLLQQTREKAAGKRIKEIFRELLEFDRDGFQGNRSIHTGLLALQDRGLLSDFDFNPRSRPGKRLGDGMKLDFTKGTLCLSDFSPALLLSETSKTSKVKVRFLLSQVDFLKGEYMTYMSRELVLTAEDPDRDLHLRIGEVPEGDGFLFGYLWLGFERDDAVAVPELLWHVDDVFRVIDFSSEI